MKELKKIIAFCCSVLMLAIVTLPSLHALEHEVFNTAIHSDSSATVAEADLSCTICDFHIQGFQEVEFFSYQIFTPNAFALISEKATSQLVSIASQTTFSLRAPPVLS